MRRLIKRGDEAEGGTGGHNFIELMFLRGDSTAEK
jgi:hypothetical protein